MSQLSKRKSNLTREDLCCCWCKGPLRVLPDGNSICERYFDLKTTVTPNSRIQNLEYMLGKNKAVFPCKYQNDGCTASLISDSNHEHYCPRQLVSCPLPDCKLEWKGKILGIYKHFSSYHQKLIKRDARIQLQLNEYSSGTFVTCLDVELKLIVKYLYTKKCFECDVRYLTSNINVKQNISCSIQLVNVSDESYTNLKLVNSINPLSKSFYCMREAFLLHSHELKEHLTNTKCKAVELNLEITNAQTDNSTFLFSEAKSTCRQPFCTFLGQDCQVHHEICPYRLIPCFVTNCEASFQIASAVKHLETHKNVKLVEEAMCNIEFSEFCQMYVYMIKNDIAIEISFNVMTNIYNMQLLSTFTETIFLKFKPQHCDHISKEFPLIK